jgi:hypothetical protein
MLTLFIVKCELYTKFVDLVPIILTATVEKCRSDWGAIGELP